MESHDFIWSPIVNRIFQTYYASLIFSIFFSSQKTAKKGKLKIEYKKLVFYTYQGHWINNFTFPSAVKGLNARQLHKLKKLDLDILRKKKRFLQRSNN